MGPTGTRSTSRKIPPSKCSRSSRLGVTYVAPEALSDDNARKLARSSSGLQAASLIEASEKAHTLLTCGAAVEQDGEPSRNVRFFDFERPAKNDLVVTRQYTVRLEALSFHAWALAKPRLVAMRVAPRSAERNDHGVGSKRDVSIRSSSR